MDTLRTNLESAAHKVRTTSRAARGEPTIPLLGQFNDRTYTVVHEGHDSHQADDDAEYVEMETYQEPPSVRTANAEPGRQHRF